MIPVLSTVSVVAGKSALVWRRGRVCERVEITETEALDRLAGGFDWQYDHPGFLTFTLPDGDVVELEAGFAPGHWYVPAPTR